MKKKERRKCVKVFKACNNRQAIFTERNGPMILGPPYRDTVERKRQRFAVENGGATLLAAVKLRSVNGEPALIFLAGSDNSYSIRERR